MLSCLSPRRPCCGPKAALSFMSPQRGERVERMREIARDGGGVRHEGHALALQRGAQGGVSEKPVDSEFHVFSGCLTAQ
jgi:hypothetical protein